MQTGKLSVVCNPVIVKDGEELMGDPITVNPLGVAMAEPCVWENNRAKNSGTLLHFINSNTPSRKIAADIGLWQQWVHEAMR